MGQNSPPHRQLAAVNPSFFLQIAQRCFTGLFCDVDGEASAEVAVMLAVASLVIGTEAVASSVVGIPEERSTGTTLDALDDTHAALSSDSAELVID